MNSFFDGSVPVGTRENGDALLARLGLTVSFVPEAGREVFCIRDWQFYPVTFTHPPHIMIRGNVEFEGFKGFVFTNRIIAPGEAVFGGWHTITVYGETGLVQIISALKQYSQT